MGLRDVFVVPQPADASAIAASVMGGGAGPRIPGAPPRVPPPPTDGGLLAWSVMIPVFNAGAFLADTLRSVLAQDPGRATMQIAVVDDASTDINVRELVEQIAGDRVEYHRQCQNVGSVRNFNTSIGLSRGRLVHLLHADDRVAAANPIRNMLWIIFMAVIGGCDVLPSTTQAQRRSVAR